MSWLDAGHIDGFLKQAEKNVQALSSAVEVGKDVIVIQPTCGYTLKKEYAQYLGTDSAKKVGSCTFDIGEYLMRIHRNGGGLDTSFTGAVPETVSRHVPCHLRAQNIGPRSKELMELTGAKVTPIERCAGIDGTWGLRAKNYEMARKVAQPLKQAIESANCSCIAATVTSPTALSLRRRARRPSTRSRSSRAPTAFRRRNLDS